MSRTSITIPDDWIADIRDAIERPEQFKYAGWPIVGDKRRQSVRDSIVIPQILTEQFERFHSRGVMHSKTKGEHEAAALLNFYVIWKYKLFAGEYDSWEEYLRDMTAMPFSVSISHIKQGVASIDNFLARGMTIDNVLSVVGLTPTAARLLQSVDDEKLPGGDINSAAEMIIDLGTSEAIATVNDWAGRATYTGLSAIHDRAMERLYLEIRRTRVDGSYDRLNWMITDIDADASAWLMERTSIRPHKRVFK